MIISFSQVLKVANVPGTDPNFDWQIENAVAELQCYRFRRGQPRENTSLRDPYNRQCGMTIDHVGAS